MAVSFWVSTWGRLDSDLRLEDEVKVCWRTDGLASLPVPFPVDACTEKGVRYRV